MFLFMMAMLALGVACVFFPKRVQAIAIRALEMGSWPRPEALKTFVHSGAYLWNVRLAGFVALLMAAMLVFAITRSG
jgi:hypothetical protein